MLPCLVESKLRQYRPDNW